MLSDFVEELPLRGFLSGSYSKESACNKGDPGSVPGSGRPPGEGNSYLLQFHGQGVCWPIVYGVADTIERLTLLLNRSKETGKLCPTNVILFPVS